VQAAKTQYRGLWLLVRLNWDVALFIGTIGLALSAGSWIMSAHEQVPFVIY